MDGTRRRSLDSLKKGVDQLARFYRSTGVQVLVGEFTTAAWALEAHKYLRLAISLFEVIELSWVHLSFRSTVPARDHEGLNRQGWTNVLAGIAVNGWKKRTTAGALRPISGSVEINHRGT